MKRKMGIIGLGNFGKKHLSELRRSDYFDLVGVCDKNESLREDGRFEFYTDLGDLFALAKPEAIIISSPTKYHKEHILEALKYIKFIFVESPCTINIDQAREMRYAAHSNGAKIAVGFNSRFSPTVEALKRELEKDDKIYSITLISADKERANLNMIDDMLVRDIDVVRFLTNSDIVSVDIKKVKHDENKETIHSSLKTKSETLVNICSTSSYPTTRAYIEASTSSGVYVGDLIGFSMHKFTQNGRINLKVDGEDFSLRKEHELFAKVCNGGEFEALANIDDIIKIREILK